MFGYLHLLVPIILAAIPIALRVKRKRFAFIWILFGYVTYALGNAILAAMPIYEEMMQSGQGDPELMAGQISEVIVTSLLFAVIAIPVALLLFWAYRKFKSKA